MENWILYPDTQYSMRGSKEQSDAVFYKTKSTHPSIASTWSLSVGEVRCGSCPAWCSEGCLSAFQEICSLEKIISPTTELLWRQSASFVCLAQPALNTLNDVMPEFSLTLDNFGQWFSSCCPQSLTGCVPRLRALAASTSGSYGSRTPPSALLQPSQSNERVAALKYNEVLCWCYLSAISSVLLWWASLSEWNTRRRLTQCFLLPDVCLLFQLICSKRRNKLGLKQHR